MDTFSCGYWGTVEDFALFINQGITYTVKCTIFQCSSLLRLLTNEGLTGNCSHHQDMVGFHHPQICLASFWLPFLQPPGLATTDLLSVPVVVPEYLQDVISVQPCRTLSLGLASFTLPNAAESHPLWPRVTLAHASLF